MGTHISGGTGERAFGRLGRFIVRHPWYPIIFWVVILLIALPFLSQLGNSTTNSTTSLPATAPSSIANAAIAKAFPNGTGGSSSIVVLVGANLTGTAGQASVMALDRSISSDPNLQDLAGVTTLYTAYTQYLVGQVSIGLSTLTGATRGPTSVLPEVNSTSTLIWGPPTTFVNDWLALIQSNSSIPAQNFSYEALEQANATYHDNASLQLVLSSFYYGYRDEGGGFNGTAHCATSPSTVVSCADNVGRDNLASLLPRTGTLASQRIVPGLVLNDLGIENATSWPAIQGLTLVLLGETSGVSTPWLTELWTEFPSLGPSLIAVGAWSEDVVDNGTVASYPLPVPPSLAAGFLSSDGQAELVLVDFTQPSGYIDSHGNMPIYSDVDEINRIGPSTVAQAAPGSGIAFYQTGGAALDENENTDLSQTLALVLPLTIIVLIGITMVYFRTPVAPALTFSGIAIALVLGLAGVVLIAHAITKVDVTSLELEDTFVLGVGTDYSIFLVARYREEITRGVDSKDAVVASVTWAGQSIATSGTAAAIATLALAFSGVALLSQWGIVLSLAVLVTVLISLTMVPAFLTLLGPRMFWPNTGERFRQQQQVANERFRAEGTYFHRAARLSQKRPKTIIAFVLLVSIPLIYIAVISPLSYNFYQQIPAGQPATNGLAELNSHFGPGYAFPIEVLVTFTSPLVVGNQTNASEFVALDNLTTTFNRTPGVDYVNSPTGVGGAPLNTWLDFEALPPATEASLGELLTPFVGAGGTSVLLTVVPNASGLSYTAVTLVNQLSGDIYNFQLDHPSASAVYFGGGAATTRDL
ncbi:MAG: MMPL family transporter, partial [Thermoplasmata archaeon]|nr:MMPL family transporter [Thermoplasmata archaeon]